MLRKSMLILLVLVIIFSATLVSANNLGFEDMPEDWSREALQNAIDNDLLNGSKGKILPNDNLTRAEMATIINRSFRSYEKSSLEGFKDIFPEDWYYEEMAKAVQMKTFNGNNGLLNPDNPILREEAFVVISRAFKVDKASKSPKGYLDLGDISPWAKEDIYGLINAGYIEGFNGKINPKGTITRAEFAQLMYNIVKSYINTPGVHEVAKEGNVMINVPGVILKDSIIDGDLIIGEGVGSGDVILDNMIVNGKIVIRGGGENSIIIADNSKVKKIIVSRLDGPVRVKVEDDSSVDLLIVDDGKDKVILEGTMKNIVIKTSEFPIMLERVKANSIIKFEPETEIIIDKDSQIGNM